MIRRPLTVLLVVFVASLVLSSCAHAAEFEDFAHAINQVETGGKSGYILGDKGHSLGPMQIQENYFLDSQTKGHYLQCTNYNFSCVVVKNYLKRFNPEALKKKDWETCARIHNGGPKGASDPHTIIYWRRVKKFLRS